MACWTGVPASEYLPPEEESEADEREQQRIDQQRMAAAIAQRFGADA